MKRKSGFTMVEIILILVIISTALITIISGVTKTIRYVSEMRQRTIALNLAKEGIEAVYNIRNTNWRRRSANRDQCWLKVNPMVDEGNDGCENDPRFAGGSRYAINTTNGSHHFTLEEVASMTGNLSRMDDLANRVKDSNALNRQIKTIEKRSKDPKDPHRKYFVHFIDGKGIDHQTFSGLPEEEKKRETRSLGRYRRFISGGGLYSKENGNLLNCNNGVGNCGDSSPKELRFCSTVIYSSPYQGIVNLCAIMTNFLE